MNDFDSETASSNSIDGNRHGEQESKKRVTNFLSRYFSLFLISFAVISSSLSLVMTFRLSSEFQVEISDLVRKIEGSFAEDRESIDNFKEQIFSIEKTLTSIILDLENQIKDGGDHLNSEIGKIDRDSFGIREPIKHVRFLLIEAYRALRWYRDTDHAILLLKNANKFIESGKWSEYQAFTDMISAQVRELELLEVDNFSALFVKFDELTDLVDGLQFMRQEVSSNAAHEDSDTYWDEIWQALEQLVLIRSVSQSSDKLKSSGEIDGSLMKLEWKLYVQEMRLAVLSQDQDLYQDLVKRFEGAIRRVEPRIHDVMTFQTLIKELGTYNVSPLSSDIEDILRKIQVYTERSS